mmetsp:Transcript_26234/g.73590  ORF Transcript_26234/g.73590 Transcript_26234/m.73590 type:complete len:265 (-) Transcript_26234:1506-2300(-)
MEPHGPSRTTARRCCPRSPGIIVTHPPGEWLRDRCSKKSVRITSASSPVTCVPDISSTSALPSSPLRLNCLLLRVGSSAKERAFTRPRTSSCATTASMVFLSIFPAGPVPRKVASWAAYRWRSRAARDQTRKPLLCIALSSHAERWLITGPSPSCSIFCLRASDALSMATRAAIWLSREPAAPLALASALLRIALAASEGCSCQSLGCWMRSWPASHLTCDNSTEMRPASAAEATAAIQPPGRQAAVFCSSFSGARNTGALSAG